MLYDAVSSCVVASLIIIGLDAHHAHSSHAASGGAGPRSTIGRSGAASSCDALVSTIIHTRSSGAQRMHSPCRAAHREAGPYNQRLGYSLAFPELVS